MGPQHALLCVKQAKAYLDDVLAMGWDGAASRIREAELSTWFGNKQGFGKAACDGAGEPSIRAFLGGAFAGGLPRAAEQPGELLRHGGRQGVLELLHLCI